MRQILWLNSERAHEKQSLMFPALSSSACGTSEWRTTGSVFKREQGCEAPLPLSLSPSLSLSLSLTYIHSLCLSLTLAHSHLLQLTLFPALHEALRQICADRQRASVKAKWLSLSRCLHLSRPLLVSMCVCVFVCLKDSACRQTAPFQQPITYLCSLISSFSPFLSKSLFSHSVLSILIYISERREFKYRHCSHTHTQDNLTALKLLQPLTFYLQEMLQEMLRLKQVTKYKCHILSGLYYQMR